MDLPPELWNKILTDATLSPGPKDFANVCQFWRNTTRRLIKDRISLLEEFSKVAEEFGITVSGKIFFIFLPLQTYHVTDFQTYHDTDPIVVARDFQRVLPLKTLYYGIDDLFALNDRIDIKSFLVDCAQYSIDLSERRWLFAILECSGLETMTVSNSVRCLGQFWNTIVPCQYCRLIPARHDLYFIPSSRYRTLSYRQYQTSDFVLDSLLRLAEEKTTFEEASAEPLTLELVFKSPDQNRVATLYVFQSK